MVSASNISHTPADAWCSKVGRSASESEGLRVQPEPFPAEFGVNTSITNRLTRPAPGRSRHKTADFLRQTAIRTLPRDRPGGGRGGDQYQQTKTSLKYKRASHKFYSELDVKGLDGPSLLEAHQKRLRSTRFLMGFSGGGGRLGPQHRGLGGLLQTPSKSALSTRA